VLRAYDAQVTVIPEGDDVHEVLGWASLSPKRYSAGGTYLNLKKRYRMDARLLGGPRAIIVSNEYDKVFPMDIFPEQLIKATLAFNIEKMERLGIYEVAPEDFALLRVRGYLEAGTAAHYPYRARPASQGGRVGLPD